MLVVLLAERWDKKPDERLVEYLVDSTVVTKVFLRALQLEMMKVVWRVDTMVLQTVF
jgi:hypothetical protein